MSPSGCESMRHEGWAAPCESGKRSVFPLSVCSGRSPGNSTPARLSGDTREQLSSSSFSCSSSTSSQPLLQHCLVTHRSSATVLLLLFLLPQLLFSSCSSSTSSSLSSSTVRRVVVVVVRSPPVHLVQLGQPGGDVMPGDARCDGGGRGSERRAG
ncbi:hypothetical protein NHX12_005850 [Muraenolepis orangiensis]|uniref:Uncharacterized protein n=1 Tax=Muraenolepis orangiensis TaxID=630683 RepID=A0A9Q0IE36_9TELE|nr:hypothetical protein NHX12_005850 [Muraenolepis orangiensis]